MIGDDHARFPARAVQGAPSPPVLHDAGRSRCLGSLPDIRAHTEPPSAGELVVYEIQRPAGIGFSLDEDRRTRAAGTPSSFRLRTESASLRYSR